MINLKDKAMYYETNCTCITLGEWETLMKGSRKCSYKKLVRRIELELPGLYHELALQYYNPFGEQCKQTKTHFILVHSGIEYFLHK